MNGVEATLRRAVADLDSARANPQDAVDLNALRGVLGADERDLASEAVALIEARGYARGRDLGLALTRLLSRAP